MSRREKFSEKSVRAFSSQNWTWEGVELAEGEEEAAAEQRGFWDGVDLRLGAIEQANRIERERERETNRKVPTQINNKIERIEGMYAWIYDMQ